MRTLKARFIALSVVLVAMSAGMGGAALWSNAALQDALGANILLGEAQHHQADADMMHDALRGDVYETLHAVRAGQPVTVEIADHLADLRASVAATAALPLGDAVEAALAGVRSDLEAYASAADAIVATAKRDPAAAEAQLPAFGAAFQTLETSMGAVSDVIGAAAAANGAAAAEVAALTDRLTWSAAAASVLLSAGFAAYLLLGVLKPLGRMTSVMDRLAAGDTGLSVGGHARRDEIGAMARAVETFRANAVRIAGLSAEDARRSAEAEAARRRELAALADTLEASVSAIARTVGEAAAETGRAADEVSQSVAATRERATSAAGAAEQAASNVATVSAAAEEMTATFGEVSAQVARAAAIARSATEATERTNRMVADLAVAADTIGKVVGLISDVAAQTNLLALNATIEAARAGEAGRGFAVVAAEVKALAAQTTTAAETITQQVGAIQDNTRAAVDAIRRIGETVHGVDEVSAAIAAAVEEQEAATRDIAASVSEAAVGTREVSRDIQSVSAAADRAQSAASTARQVSLAMRGEADDLNRTIRDALGRLRAG